MPGTFDPEAFDSSFVLDGTAQAGPELSNFEAICAILLAPAQEFDNVAITVRDESVDTAVGVNLDRKYGGPVGLRRSFSPLFSTDDDAYRRGIRAWIAANHSTGQREQLINIARLILDDATAKVVIRRDGTASLFVQITGAAVLSTTEAVLVLFLTAAVSQGVRVTVQSNPRAPTSAFKFGGTGAARPVGPGFDNAASPGVGGHLADRREIVE